MGIFTVTFCILWTNYIWARREPKKGFFKKKACLKMYTSLKIWGFWQLLIISGGKNSTVCFYSICLLKRLITTKCVHECAAVIIKCFTLFVVHKNCRKKIRTCKMWRRLSTNYCEFKTTVFLSMASPRDSSRVNMIGFLQRYYNTERLPDESSSRVNCRILWKRSSTLKVSWSFYAPV